MATVEPRPRYGRRSFFEVRHGRTRAECGELPTWPSDAFAHSTSSSKEDFYGWRRRVLVCAIVRYPAERRFRAWQDNAHTRTPFPGVAPFYTALQAEQGVPTNPIFYVSSSPTNLYELFVDFMHASEIPVGPIMLNDFGFEDDKFLKSNHSDYKRDRIESVMEAFPRLSFILVGDSGQQDPEIYRELVEKWGDRVMAIYIRDVSDDERTAAVEAIAAEVREAGVPMLMMKDSLEAAEHAAEQRWITPDELEEVRSHVENPKEHRRERGLLGSKVAS